MRKSLLQQLWVKNTIMISFPSVISLLGIVITFVSGNAKIIMGCISVFLMILLVLFVIYYANQEDKTNKEMLELKEKNKNLEVIAYHLKNIAKTSTYSINSFSEFVETWAKSINYFANQVNTNGMAPEKCWDKIKFFDEICVQCRNMIKVHCDNNDNSRISVGFISYRKDNDTKVEWVNMIAHSSPESTRPHSYGAEEKLTSCVYHYADLIKDNVSDIEVAIDNNEICRIFKKVSISTDLSKYTQYIAIPVYCANKTLLGIFQIVTKYDYIIEKDKVTLRKFAEENIIPFSNLIVLVENINKGLYVKPN